MRKLVFIGLTALGMSGCADDSQRQTAILQCQQVGITQKDPQFDVCTRAYSLQAKQDSLETAYDRALNATYDRKLPHQWYGF